MNEVTLRGRLDFFDLKKGYKPEYMFLPQPTKVRSEFEELTVRQIEMIKPDISWEANWKGIALCEGVLGRSRMCLDQNRNVHSTLIKVRSLVKNDRKAKREMNSLIKNCSQQVRRWKEIVEQVEGQIKG